MNYPKCSQFHSNYKKESDIMRCLNEGRQFACLGIYEDIVFDNPSKLKFHPRGSTSGLKIFFKDMYVFKMLEEIMNINNLVLNFRNHKQHWSNRIISKETKDGDIVLGLMLGICVYDIIQDSHILTIASEEYKAYIFQLKKFFNDKVLHENDNFKTIIEQIFIKKYSTMIDAFNATQRICTDFINYMNNETQFTKNYAIAYDNILTGTYFHIDCDFLFNIQNVTQDTSTNNNLELNVNAPDTYTLQSKPVLSPQLQTMNKQRRQSRTQKQLNMSVTKSSQKMSTDKQTNYMNTPVDKLENLRSKTKSTRKNDLFSAESEEEYEDGKEEEFDENDDEESFTGTKLNFLKFFEVKQPDILGNLLSTYYDLPQGKEFDKNLLLWLIPLPKKSEIYYENGTNFNQYKDEHKFIDIFKFLVLAILKVYGLI